MSRITERVRSASSHPHPPEYYERTYWPAAIGLGTGVALTGLFLLMKGFVFPAAALLAFSFVGVLAAFLYHDTKSWRTAIVTSLGRIPRDGVLGPFPVDVNLTIQIVILTELLLFGGAFGMYFAGRAGFAIWPPPGAPILDDFIPRLQTLILISSSVLIEWSIWQLRRGREKTFKVGLVGTTVLGSFFPILQFGLEWPYLLLNNVLTPSSGFFGASFFLLTGIHGAHVIAGVLGFCVAVARGLMGQYSARNYGFVEATSTYWHFVHIIWLLLFALLWQGSRIMS